MSPLFHVLCAAATLTSTSALDFDPSRAPALSVAWPVHGDGAAEPSPGLERIDAELLPKHSRLRELEADGQTQISGIPASTVGKAGGIAVALLVLLALPAFGGPRLAAVARAIRYGGFYIVASSMMIESNKWLMQSGRFPYPFSLTFNHMISCTILANILRKVCPSLFPALEGLNVTPTYCVKFMGLGIPFMLSTVCGNWAYEYLSVSFLQIMKQTNIVTIYILSVVVGLEAPRWCSATLLLVVLAGALMAVRGEMHFSYRGFFLQVVSSWSEAAKVVVQSILMSGQAKLDPLTMVLFMAPACFVANLLPWIFAEGHEIGSVVTKMAELWPLVLGNVFLAFILNVAVALCIRELSAVGYLLCGIVKDNCIILTSTIFLGESLSRMEHIGFIIALGGVLLYSLYKQNIDCFQEDSLGTGFHRMSLRWLFGNSLDPRGLDTKGAGAEGCLAGDPEISKEDNK